MNSKLDYKDRRHAYEIEKEIQWRLEIIINELNDLTNSIEMLRKALIISDPPDLSEALKLREKSLADTARIRGEIDREALAAARRSGESDMIRPI